MLSVWMVSLAACFAACLMILCFQNDLFERQTSLLDRMRAADHQTRALTAINEAPQGVSVPTVALVDKI